MKWTSAISEKSALNAALEECGEQISEGLSGLTPDLVCLFVTPHYATEYSKISDTVSRLLNAKVVFGCSGGGVIGSGKEVEFRPAISMSAASLPGVDLLPFHLEENGLPDLDAAPEAWHHLISQAPLEPTSILLLADPFTFHAEPLIRGLDYAYPTTTKIGGLASGGRRPGQNLLLLSGQEHYSGAIGVALQGNVAVEPIVAQGCRPIGPVLCITSCDQHLLIQLDGQPALELLQTLYQTLTEEDRYSATHSLFLGIAMDTFSENLGPGDFLVRNLLGIDPRTGVIGVGETLQEGQLVRFHIRDRETSRQDLVALLEPYQGYERENPHSGCLMFSCLGRGEGLYGVPNHDSEVFANHLGNIPLTGFFCNGEIGPVGTETFLHGYTSAFGLFRPLIN